MSSGSQIYIAYDIQSLINGWDAITAHKTKPKKGDYEILEVELQP